MTTRIAIVDGGSFVLPYDFQLVRALVARGAQVDVYASQTRYNGDFLDALRRQPNVRVISRAVSGTVSPRWKGVPAYAALLARLCWNARRYDVVNLQFSVLWLLEWPLWWALRRKLVFTVHNAVPHGFAGTRHRPTQRIAQLARTLLFVSEATRDDFLRRYGERLRAKCELLPHGLLPVAPQVGAVPYGALKPPRALVFWSTVKAYKGVELFVQLARSDELRRRGLSLEVYGAWDRDLGGLRQQLRELGVAVHDEYLDDSALLALLARDAVFVLPYREASQSGALYALLNHGRVFLCSDVGDLGAFMRRHGLAGLLLRERSAGAVIECLDYLAAHADAVARSLDEAQRRCGWDALLREAGAVYGLPQA